MASPISVLCLLMTAGMLLGLDTKQAQYRQENGMFINCPETALSLPSRISCAISCIAIKPWFCGGFTYHHGGTCHLYRGNEKATCINPEEAVPGLEVDTGSEPRSYRRLQSTCPGSESEPCGCPAGFSRCAGRCLQLLNQEVNYADAEALCAELGGHLAVPRSQAENQCALDMAQGIPDVFIGATRLDTEGTFVGADGECGPVPASEGWWANGQPDNIEGGQDCTTLWNAWTAWADVFCSSTYPSLCQLSGCYKPQCQ